MIMKLILGILMGGFVGLILGWDGAIHFYQWGFYAMVVPFAIVLVIYGSMKW